MYVCVCCRLCRCLDLASTTMYKVKQFSIGPRTSSKEHSNYNSPSNSFHQTSAASTHPPVNSSSSHLYSLFNMPLRQSYSDHVRFSRQFLFISPLVFHHRIESRKSSTPGRSGCSLRIFTGKLCVTIRCVNVLSCMRHSLCLAHT